MFGIDRTIGLVVAVLVLAVILITVGPAACNRIRALEAQSRVNEGQMGASKDSSKDALKTQSDLHKREAERAEQTAKSEREIRDAEGADDKVNSGVRDAGFRALCMRDSFRRSERGRVLCANSR